MVPHLAKCAVDTPAKANICFVSDDGYVYLPGCPKDVDGVVHRGVVYHDCAHPNAAHALERLKQATDNASRIMSYHHRRNGTRL
jgi:hypothetical protein